jgi:hypothetical protein
VRLRRGVEQALRGVVLAALRQQPRIQHRAGDHLPVRAGGVRAERHRAAVLAALHVRTHERHLGVGRVLHQRRALAGAECRFDVAARERRFPSREQDAAFALPLLAFRLGLCCGCGVARALEVALQRVKAG